MLLRVKKLIAQRENDYRTRDRIFMINPLEGYIRFIRFTLLMMGGASLLLMTGCREISTTHTQDIGRTRFSPSDPAQIEILRDVPATPHVELGQVWGHSSDTSGDVSKLETALRKEAAMLGADAIVVWQDRIGTWDAADSRLGGGRSVDGVHGRTVIGAAIKYL
jgi:hypothetical protein